MPTIIKEAQIQSSEFAVVQEPEASIEANNVILPLKFYIEHRQALMGRNDVGVWLEAGEDIEDIESFAHEFPVIALNFPAFSDGRSYSNANILRRRFQYQGEIRAIGDVRRDQLNQMLHCGFDAFEMADGQDMEAALQGLQAFSHNYQATVAAPEPLSRKR